jgi:hypothetical protein
LIFLVVFVVYKPEVVGLLRRLRKLTLPGGAGGEFDPAQLDHLNEVASAAARSTPPPTAADVPAGMRTDSATATAVEDEVLRDAATSPRAGLMLLAAQIERAVREILATSQDPRNWEGRSLRQMIDRLEVSPAVRAAVDDFLSVRNRIVHGRSAGDDDVLRAIDSGLSILRTLDAIPRAVHVVMHPQVELFEDERLSQLRPVRGVMLESGPNGEGGAIAVFPTTKTYFREGMRVTWEWNPNLVVGESWYRDADNGEPVLAFSGAMEFVGRDIEAL